MARSVQLAASRRTALLGAMSVLLAGASPWAGAAERAQRLTPFSILQLEFPARYVIRNAGAPGARLVGPAQVLERIVVEQHDERVRVFAPGSVSVQGELLIEISTVGLGELSVDGAGDVEAWGFNGPEFKLRLSGAPKLKLTALDVDRLLVDMSGSSNAEIKGRATSERVMLGGACSYHAADLSADKVEVKLEGAGDVEVLAREKLRVKLTGAGNVRYRGEPKLSSDINGVGTISRM